MSDLDWVLRQQEGPDKSVNPCGTRGFEIQDWRRL